MYRYVDDLYQEIPSMRKMWVQNDNVVLRGQSSACAMVHRIPTIYTMSRP